MKKSFLMVALPFILIAVGGCSKDEEKGIFSSGQVTIRSTWACNLDQGIEATSNDTSDFEWSNQPPHYLEPVNGAKFFLVGSGSLDSLEYDTLTGYTYSNDFIWEDSLAVGTVVAGITKQGRYCKFRIDAKPDDLTITWVTYEL
jgi:hypothetical protein